MSTEIYGTSDDLVEVDGDVRGEVNSVEADERPVLLVCSDGTILEVQYGKAIAGIWRVSIVKTGDLFDRLETCEDENAERYSDTAYFKDGLKWAIAAKEWERVR